jgi:hypothetical protein
MCCRCGYEVVGAGGDVRIGITVSSDAIKHALLQAQASSKRILAPTIQRALMSELEMVRAPDGWCGNVATVPGESRQRPEGMTPCDSTKADDVVATVRVDVAALPTILVLWLGMVQCIRDPITGLRRNLKICEPVVIEEELSLCGVKYDCVWLAVHSGTDGNGHWYAVVKTDEVDRHGGPCWYLADDANVRRLGTFASSAMDGYMRPSDRSKSLHTPAGVGYRVQAESLPALHERNRRFVDMTAAAAFDSGPQRVRRDDSEAVPHAVEATMTHVGSAAHPGPPVSLVPNPAVPQAAPQQLELEESAEQYAMQRFPVFFKSELDPTSQIERLLANEMLETDVVNTLLQYVLVGSGSWPESYIC